MQKKLLLSIAIVTLAGATYLGTTYAFAENADDPQESLVQKISTKFGLNQNDVQAVFDEHKQEMHAKMQARIEQRVAQLVTEGKITEEQKTKLLQKFSEQKTAREADREQFKNMTREERKAELDKKHEELKAWAEENGIDLQMLHSTFGHKMGKGKPMMN